MQYFSSFLRCYIVSEALRHSHILQHVSLLFLLFTIHLGVRLLSLGNISLRITQYIRVAIALSVFWRYAMFSCFDTDIVTLCRIAARTSLC